jgi:hypothetical protein
MGDTSEQWPAGVEGGIGTDASSSRWPGVLVGLTTILAIISVFSVWARVQLLDTDEWVDLSTELVEQPEVHEALAEYLVGALYDEGDLVAGVEARLPTEFRGIAGLITGALRDPLTSGVERLLASDRFQARWESANRTAHEALVAILRDETRPGISTADGTVALEVRPMVVAVGESLGIPAERLDQIPQDAGRIVVFESDDLDAAQQVVRVLDFLAWFLFVLVVVLYAVAVFLARGRRRRMLGIVGWSIAAVGLVVLLVQAVARRALVDAIVDDPANRSLADVTTGVATGLLRQMGWSALIYGVLIATFAWLLGDHPWAVATRRKLAPVTAASGGVVAAATAIVLLVLWMWSPGRVFEGWATGLTLVGLVVAATFALRARTLAEADGDQPVATVQPVP